MAGAPIDGATFRRVLGHYPTGVCVVTAAEADGGRVGMVVGSFGSVSLEPPLVAFFPDRKSSTWPRIAAAGRFCVNVLASDQQELCRQFAAKGADKFAGVTWTPAPGTGSPLIQDTLAYVDCRIHQVIEAGDHHVVIGRVLDLGLPADDSGIDWPLLFYRGQYATTDAENA